MDLQKTMTNLKDEGFLVSYFESGKEASDYLTAQIVGKTVGIGGSMTVEALGLFDRLTPHNEVYWHWKQPAKEARENATHAQVYISSANAIAETGEIINIDGTGNRVASLLYGHEKVFIVVGINKIAENYDAAMWRARNIAAPLNAKRLGLKTPCAVSEEMKCYNCKSADRICKGVSLLWQKVGGIGEMEVVIIGESLGY